MKPAVLSIAALTLFTLCHCSPVGGRQGAPESAAVDELMIPFDRSRPRFLIIAAPVTIKDLKRPEYGRSEGPIVPCEEFLTAMLTTSLAGAGNFMLLDPSMPHSLPEGGGIVGPIQVQVQLTEMNQFAEIEEGGFDPWRFDSGWDYVWKLPITTVAFWTTMLTGLPVAYTTISIKGVVALDVSAVDLSTGEVVTSFPVRGTHSEEGRRLGSIFGAYSKKEVRSTFSGASRVAINSAVRRLYDSFSDRYRTAY